MKVQEQIEMNKDVNRRKSQSAVELVKAYEAKSGRKVKKAHRGSGYDLISCDSRGRRRNIEVKGTKKPELAIPDLAKTEFDEQGRRLKATHLYIVADINRKPVLYVITRNQLSHAGGATRLVRWRVQSRAQKRLREVIKGEILKRGRSPKI